MESEDIKVIDSSEVYEPPMLLDLEDVESCSGCDTGGASTC